MANSDEDHLEFLKLSRDKVTEAITSGEDATTVTVGPKTATYKSRDFVLEKLEEQIAKYERKIALTSPSSKRRNRARLLR